MPDLDNLEGCNISILNSSGKYISLSRKVSSAGLVMARRETCRWVPGYRVRVAAVTSSVQRHNTQQ